MESAATKLPTATSNLLLKSSRSKEKKIKFRGYCAAILMNIILKLQERSPFKKKKKERSPVKLLVVR